MPELSSNLKLSSMNAVHCTENLTSDITADLDSEVVLPVVGQRLVELAVFLLGDVVGVAGPDRLRLVQLLILERQRQTTLTLRPEQRQTDHPHTHQHPLSAHSL